MESRIVHGKTLFFANIEPVEGLIERLRGIGLDRFTGELEFVLEAEPGAEKRAAILVLNGQVVYVAVDGREAGLEEAVQSVIGARSGFLEAVQLEPGQVEVELEYRFHGARKPGPRASRLIELLEAEAEKRHRTARTPTSGFEAGAREPRRVTGGEAAKPVQAPVVNASRLRSAVEEVLDVEPVFVDKLSQARARSFQSILMVLREKSSTIKRMKNVEPLEAVSEAAKLATSEGYAGIHVIAPDREALVVMRGQRLCIALERGRNGIRVLDEDAVEGFLKQRESLEYAIFPISPEHLNRLLPECMTEEERSASSASARRGLWVSIQRVFGRKS